MTRPSIEISNLGPIGQLRTGRLPRRIVPCCTQVFAASLIEPAFATPPLLYYTTCRFARTIGYF